VSERERERERERRKRRREMEVKKGERCHMLHGGMQMHKHIHIHRHDREKKSKTRLPHACRQYSRSTAPSWLTDARHGTASRTGSLRRRRKRSCGCSTLTYSTNAPRHAAGGKQASIMLLRMEAEERPSLRGM
jgi:hypothetical protein